MRVGDGDVPFEAEGVEVPARFEEVGALPVPIVVTIGG